LLLRQLEYFVALADERHFARAAAACYVSQPALSEGLAKLEKELDVSLIQRSHAFEGLTPEGERLVVWARRILADHEAMKQEVSAMRTGLSGRLRIGTIPGASTTVAALVDAVVAAHPLVTVEIDAELPSTEIARRVRHFELDAGVLYLAPELTAELLEIPLYQERQVLLAPVGLVPESASVLRWADAARLPLCLLASSMHGRRIVDETMGKAGADCTPQVEADSIATLAALVATGRWAGIIPHPWAQTLARAPGVRVLPLIEPETSSQVGLVTSAGSPASMVAEALAEVARRSDSVSF
jgi:DNA-binding transcriptional LysR family regulator